MPSLPDTAVIIFLGLLLFGPKGLAQIARQLGKLMGEFRRASNDFRMQMEEELRISEQADRQKQIAAIEAAAPAPPVLPPTPILSGQSEEPAPTSPAPTLASTQQAIPEPLPIASSGDLSIMPPSTGLPTPRSSSSAVPAASLPEFLHEPPSLSSPSLSSPSLTSLIDSVPKVAAPGDSSSPANGHAGALAGSSAAEDQRPMRYTTGNPETNGTRHHVAAEEPLHG